jgi:hypothetical protein
MRAMIWCAIWPPVTLLHNFQLTLWGWKVISAVCGLTPFEVQYGVSWLSTSVRNTITHNRPLLVPLKTLPRAARNSKPAKLAACGFCLPSTIGRQDSLHSTNTSAPQTVQPLSSQARSSNWCQWHTFISPLIITPMFNTFPTPHGVYVQTLLGILGP